MADYDGSITIKLGLNQSEYDKGLNTATKSAESFVDKVKSTFVGAVAFKTAAKGWDLISGSIDKATARLDAMQKATQVMGILAGSTDKAQEVVNRLNAAVTDTAYGLDAAATSTQKLATSGLDLDKSAQMVQDLMDAISFYGDGTNATLENVVDAMAKMNASGKISSDQWQRLTDAGVPLLKIFAEETGMSMAKVMDSFSTGAISAEKFNDILMDALENGTESFPAVAGKAKEMAGSFATSFSNMGARIAIGVGNVITAFNNFLQDSGLPSLQSLIANFGTVIKTGLNWVAENLPVVLNGAIDLIKKVMENMPQLSAIIGKIVDVVRSSVGPVMDTVKSMVTWFIDNLPAVAKNLDDMMPLIIGIGTAIAAFKGYFAVITLAGNFLGMINKIKDAWALLNAVMAANPIGVVIAAVAALVAVFAYLWKTNDTFRQFWIDTWAKIKEAVAEVVTWLKKTWPEVVQAIKEAWAGIVDFFKGIAKGIQEAWQAVVTFFTVDIPAAFQAFIDKCVEVKNSVIEFFTVTIPQAIQTFIDAVIKFFATDLPYYIGYGIGWALGKIAEFGAGLSLFITETVPEFISGIIDWFMQLPGKIWDWLSKAHDKVVEWGEETIQTASETASEAINSVTDWFSKLPGKIWAWLSEALGKIRDWASQTWANAATAASNFVNTVVTWLSQLPGRIWAWLVDAIGRIVSFAGQMKDQAVTAGRNFLDGIVREVSKIPGKMLSIGSAIVNGIKSGISGAWNGLTSWFSNLGSGLIDGFKSALGIHSPSRVFRDASRWIPEGMVAGIKDRMPKAISYMKTAGDELSDAFNTDGLTARMRIEGRAGAALSGNSNVYNVQQTINSAKALTPSEIATETLNMMRRLAWQ